jgi:hypothetical protein
MHEYQWCWLKIFTHIFTNIYTYIHTDSDTDCQFKIRFIELELFACPSTMYGANNFLKVQKQLNAYNHSSIAHKMET